MDSSNLKLLRDELIRDEGMRLKSYRDSVGLWTIGVGHLLGSERRMLRITPAEADALLAADIEEAEKIARALVPEMLYWMYGDPGGPGSSGPSDPVRARALINMAFNLGPRLAGFKIFLAALRAHEWLAASEAMMLSKWARQVGKRAERLRDMILTGA
jgi:lysozyme